MKKEKKISTVNEMRELLEQSNLMVVSDYRGLNVEKISALRRSCRKSGANLRVIKNTLARKAVSGTSFAEAEALLDGPTAVTIGKGDPVGIIKVLTAFSKENESFKIRGGVVDGNRYSSEQLFRVATLPSRDAMLAKLVGSLSSPLSRMVGSLGSPLRNLLGVLQAYNRAKGGN